MRRYRYQDTDDAIAYLDAITADQDEVDDPDYVMVDGERLHVDDARRFQHEIDRAVLAQQAAYRRQRKGAA